MKLLEQRDGRILEDLFVEILAPPAAPNTETNLYHHVTRLLGGVIQTQISVDTLLSVGDYLSSAYNSESTNGLELLKTMNDMLQKDKENVILRLLRNSLQKDTLLAHRQPAVFLAEIIGDLIRYQPSNSCDPIEFQRTVEETQTLLRTFIPLLKSDGPGIGAIYRILSMRDTAR